MAALKSKVKVQWPNTMEAVSWWRQGTHRLCENITGHDNSLTTNEFCNGSQQEQVHTIPMAWYFYCLCLLQPDTKWKPILQNTHPSCSLSLVVWLDVPLRCRRARSCAKKSDSCFSRHCRSSRQDSTSSVPQDLKRVSSSNFRSCNKKKTDVS